MYRKIGKINSFDEIPWGKEIIVSGSIGKRDWMQRMKGVFEQSGNDYRFKNEFDMFTRLSPDDFISLSVLKEVNAAHKPEAGEKG